MVEILKKGGQKKNKWTLIVESIMEVKSVIIVLYIQYRPVEIGTRRH